MATRLSPSEASDFHAGRGWSRWSSMFRLAVWGGDAQCGQCGSGKVRRAWSLPTWQHAFGLDAARCETCGATFHVPRRAATVEMYEDDLEAGQLLTLPAPPEVDLAALDRDMAARLRRGRKKADSAG
jgi:hypothetical protein